MLHRAAFESNSNSEINKGERQHPVFVLGDFNSPQEGRDSGAYQIITGATRPLEVPQEFGNRFPLSGTDDSEFKLKDVKGETPRQFVSGHYATYTGMSF